RMARFVLRGPVRSNRPRRNADAELQPELVGDALFAPGRIVMNHAGDHLLKLGRQPRTTDATRLPLPKQSERLAMPTDQRCRLNNEKSGFPLKEAGPADQGEASGPAQNGEAASMAQHRDAVAHPTHSPEAGNYQENFVAYVSPYIFFDPQS